MTAFRYGRLGSWSAGAALLVLAGLFANSSAAAASCNHLVTSHTNPLVDNLNLDELIVGRSSPSLQRDRARTPLGQPDAPSRAPCSGLSCSKSVPMPVSTMTPVPDGRDRWGALSIVVVVDHTSVYRLPAHTPIADATGCKSSIFHPPRV
jgi:hypothetical protein